MGFAVALPYVLASGEAKAYLANVIWFLFTMAGLTVAFALAPYFVAASFWLAVGGLGSAILLQAYGLYAQWLSERPASHATTD